jgi:hypothetical protein
MHHDEAPAQLAMWFETMRNVVAALDEAASAFEAVYGDDATLTLLRLLACLSLTSPPNQASILPAS